jgi:hypothetical protein
MSPEVAVLVRAALVALAVFGLEALGRARARRSARAAETRSHALPPQQPPAPLVVRLAPHTKAPHQGKKAA